MNAQQVPQCKQRRVIYLLSYIHVRNPVWIETTVCLYLLYICHPVIHRELQNVVYMKKKIDVQEKGGRILSTSTCAPTVSIIHKEIKDSIKISKSKLTLTLIGLGYTYKEIGDNRRILFDQVSIINDRCNYLRKIKSFREAGYAIVYMDETWVNENHCTDYMWLPNDGSDSPKIPSGKGKRLIVLHAGTRSEGLSDGCDLVFLAKSKDGDYHQQMKCCLS